nr:hypothetical protein [Tanacetum cinerariifolium]
MPENIKLYDRTIDLEDHLSRFSSASNSGKWNMPVRCRMFQQTLDESTRGWFENLSGGSIDGWSIYQSTRITGGLLRGTPKDNIRATPSGISRNVLWSTSGGALEVKFEKPFVEATPFAREQIKGHLSAL